MSKRVTAEDVAARLKLDTDTVAHILHDDSGHRASPITREFVTRTARSMGYDFSDDTPTLMDIVRRVEQLEKKVRELEQLADGFKHRD